MFISFEGGEGGGKTVQARALGRRLSRLGFPAVLAHEPGGTPLGKKIRRWLKWSREMSPRAELSLFAASRAQLVAEVIRPALEAGSIIICDRFAESTLAYQGYGRGLDLSLIEAVNRVATGGLKSDLVVLLDIGEEGLGRKGSRVFDRFEREELAFHRRVREGYLKMAASDPERWFVVDASLPRMKVQELIWQRVESLLKGKRN